MKQFSIDLFYDLAESYIEELASKYSRDYLKKLSLEMKDVRDKVNSEIAKVKNACNEALKITKPWIGYYGGALFVNA